MGTLAIDNSETTRLYGELSVRYQALRGLYRCVASQLTKHSAPAGCIAN